MGDAPRQVGVGGPTCRGRGGAGHEPAPEGVLRPRELLRRRGGGAPSPRPPDVKECVNGQGVGGSVTSAGVQAPRVLGAGEGAPPPRRRRSSRGRRTPSGAGS